MKKLVIRLSIAFVILIILAALAVHLFLDSAIKRGVETMGPKLAKVEVKLKFVNLALLTGSGKIRELTVANPEGFKSPSAIQVGVASVALQPSSLLSDKIVVHSIELRGPEITYETDLRHNNLSKILANLEESTGGGGLFEVCEDLAEVVVAQVGFVGDFRSPQLNRMHHNLVR